MHTKNKARFQLREFIDDTDLTVVTIPCYRGSGLCCRWTRSCKWPPGSSSQNNIISAQLLLRLTFSWRKGM